MWKHPCYQAYLLPECAQVCSAKGHHYPGHTMALYQPPGAPPSWWCHQRRLWRWSRGNTPQNRQPNAAGFSIAAVHPHRALKAPLVAGWSNRWPPQHSPSSYERAWMCAKVQTTVLQRSTKLLNVFEEIQSTPKRGSTQTSLIPVFCPSVLS